MGCFACGGIVNASPGDASAGDGGASDSGWGTSDRGPWSPVCPDQAPAPDSSCPSDQNGLLCEYGNAWWNVACDTVMECYNGTWQKAGIIEGTCLPEPAPNAPACPMNIAVITDHEACSDPGLHCYYGQGPNCSCTANTETDAGPWWICLPIATCPPSRPRLGTACNDPSASCAYDECTYFEICNNGVWQATPSGC
jgi:hypothetical protein